MDLQALGFTKEELQQRVVDQLVRQLMEETSLDEDGNPVFDESPLATRLRDAVQQRIDDAVAAIAERDILPNVQTYIENVAFQPTTKWGEKNGAKMSFREYLSMRAEDYLREEVNFEGKPKGTDSYSWKGTQTRVAHLVHQHLHYEIERQLKGAVATANAAIVDGLQKTVALKLGEIAAALKVSVKTA